MPAPPGLCYWLVAGGIPLGWCGGCLAVGLVRGAVRHYCLGRCSALVVFSAALAAGSGGLGLVPGVLPSPFSPSRPAFPALCVAGCLVWVSLILACWYAIPCGLCVLQAQSGCRSGFPRVSFVFVCARALAASAPPPPLSRLVWHAHLARSRCWALVGLFHAVRAPPRVLPQSPAPFGLLGGGGGGSRFPLPGLGLRAPRGVGAGVGTRHQPHSARSCELALRAVGAARGCPGGAPLAWVWGVRGRALSHPLRLALLSVRPGPSTHWLWVRAVRAWGPVTSPTTRLLACWLCALWGRHEGARGRTPRAWASRIGRSPSPDRPSFGACRRGALPTGCGCGGCGRGNPSPTPQRALLRAGFARCGGGTRVPWGGCLLSWCGASGVGRSPSPYHPSFRACGRGPLFTGCGCGGCGRGDPSLTPQCALLRAGFARCGCGMRVPGGGASCLGVGRPGSGALPLATTCPFGRAAGALYPLPPGAGGAGVGTCHQPHRARSSVLAWRAVRAARGCPGGAPLVWVWV